MGPKPIFVRFADTKIAGYFMKFIPRRYYLVYLLRFCIVKNLHRAGFDAAAKGQKTVGKTRRLRCKLRANYAPVLTQSVMRTHPPGLVQIRLP